MGRIVFVRHGQTADNARHVYAGSTDSQLNEEGRRQVLKTARALSGKRFDVLLYGKMRRVKETAQILSEHIRIKKEVQDGRIREIDFGKFEGLAPDEIQQKFPAEWEEYMNGWQDFTFPGGDSVRAFYAQCSAFAFEARQTYAGQDILVAAHKGFIQYSVAALCGKGIEGAFDIAPLNGEAVWFEG